MESVKASRSAIACALRSDTLAPATAPPASSVKVREMLSGACAQIAADGWNNATKNIIAGIRREIQPTVEQVLLSISGQCDYFNRLNRISKVEPVLHLNVDLSWFCVVGATKSLAVVEQEPAIRQIERR